MVIHEALACSPIGPVLHVGQAQLIHRAEAGLGVDGVLQPAQKESVPNSNDCTNYVIHVLHVKRFNFRVQCGCISTLDALGNTRMAQGVSARAREAWKAAGQKGRECTEHVTQHVIETEGWAHWTLLSVLLIGMSTIAPHTAMGNSIFMLGAQTQRRQGQVSIAG